MLEALYQLVPAVHNVWLYRNDEYRNGHHLRDDYQSSATNVFSIVKALLNGSSLGM